MIFRSFYVKSFHIFKRNASIKAINIQHIGPGGFALLTVPVVTFCLGTWQVKRRTWKLNLIDEVTKKSLDPPVDLLEVDDLSKMEFRKVKMRGRFDHSKELYIGPRQLLNVNNEAGSLMSSQPKSGNLVITPFFVTDRNMTILVNRGWVPRSKTDPANRSEGQITDEIELVGVVRLPESRPQFSPKGQKDPRYFLYRDVHRMSSLTGSEPIFLDAVAETTVPGGPVGGQTRITFRNEHFSYLVTWYSLSAATLYLWYKKYVKGVKILV